MIVNAAQASGVLGRCSPRCLQRMGAPYCSGCRVRAEAPRGRASQGHAHTDREWRMCARVQPLCSCTAVELQLLQGHTLPVVFWVLWWCTSAGPPLLVGRHALRPHFDVRCVRGRACHIRPSCGWPGGGGDDLQGRACFAGLHLCVPCYRGRGRVGPPPRGHWPCVFPF